MEWREPLLDLVEELCKAIACTTRAKRGQVRICPALLLALPIIVISLVAAFAAFTIGVLLPAIPVILVLALIWYLIRPQPQALVRT